MSASTRSGHHAFALAYVSQEAAAQAALDGLELQGAGNGAMGSGDKGKKASKGKGNGGGGSVPAPVANVAATPSLYGTCRDCGKLDQGDYDAGDGLFYCNTCWNNYGK